MPKYVIEREIPEADKLTTDQLKAISQTSCGVLKKPRFRNSVVTKLCNTKLTSKQPI